MSHPAPSSRALLRWQIVRQALCPSSFSAATETDSSLTLATSTVSRRLASGFNLIPGTPLRDCLEEDYFHGAKIHENSGNMLVSYQLPGERDLKLTLIQRIDFVNQHDFEVSTTYDIDTTGLIRSWPSEDVLSYFCLNHARKFSRRRVLELGSGYGLAGFVIAATSDASEVVISDGNPRVVDYVQKNIDLNSSLFGLTKVRSATLHWDKEPPPDLINAFDIIVASDCTFFERFHEALARTIKMSLVESETSEALLFGPKRGNSLANFLEDLVKVGLQFKVVENYDSKVWEIHQLFSSCEDTCWPNYEEDNCYPLMIRIGYTLP